VLTRRITRAVADLYRGTQYVQAMDFSHRVQIEKRDQLGELGESFNKMTGSIANLVEEENKRRRLEDEIFHRPGSTKPAFSEHPAIRAGG